ncbi:MAG: TRAP transporter fused permease subunit [Clostridia bacterium]|nr:TRAP transporter fused permease subunit [Clostridia bacterium]
MKLFKKSTAPAVEKSAEEIMRELDRDSTNRQLTGWHQLTVRVIFIAYAVFMLVNTLLIANATPYTRLPLFLGLTLAVGYLKYPFNKKDQQKVNYIPWYDILCAVGSILVYGYYVVFQEKIIFMANVIGTTEIILGIIGILLLVELCRRAIGIPILCVAGAFFIYGVYYMFSNNPATAIRNIIFNLFYSMGTGIFGSPISVCSSFIILFIILGSFLEKTHIGTFFVDLANSIAGGAVGGPAKVAVISSALEGMYSGSSVANTVGSGSVTIPTMKRTGYRPEFAAAVEAAASTGGQIMPPIMGAAAFLMAEITGYPYFSIVIAAILPALLYFTGIFMMVHFEGKRLGLRGLPKETLPNFFKLLLSNGYMLLPIVVLVFCMNHFTAGMSACFAILFSLIVALIDKPALKRVVTGKMSGPRDILSAVLPLIPLAVLFLLWKVIALAMGLSIFLAMIASVACSFFTKEATLTPAVVIEGLEGGTNNSVGVSTACGIAGIISGVVTMTALGSTLINVIVPLAEKGTLIALFLTMICCIVLGMGVPTTANYVIMATITAPILIEMGIPMLAAHMFVFYFGIVADITPPVALAAYAGSAIAKSNPLQTGIQATKLAITAFIVPYIFAYSPTMLLVIEGYEPTIFQVISIFATSLIGIYAISSGMEGFMHHHEQIWQRILLIAAGLCMIIPETFTDIIGLALIAFIIVFQYVIERKKFDAVTESPAPSENE